MLPGTTTISCRHWASDLLVDQPCDAKADKMLMPRAKGLLMIMLCCVVQSRFQVVLPPPQPLPNQCKHTRQILRPDHEVKTCHVLCCEPIRVQVTFGYGIQLRQAFPHVIRLYVQCCCDLGQCRSLFLELHQRLQQSDLA